MKKRLMLLSAIIIAAIISFIFDKPIYLWIISYREESILFNIITNGWFLVIVMYLLPSIYFYFRKKEYFIFHWLTLAFSYLLAVAFKYLFIRPRPFEALSLLPSLGASGYSFPSAHAATAFAALPLLFLLLPKQKMLFAVLAVLIGFSRIIVGVHYLSDVLVGVLLGFVVGELMLHFTRHYKGPLKLEINRQFFHAGLGILIVFLLKEEIINLAILLIIFIIGLIISETCRETRVPFFSYMLEHFDREHNVPGYGSITFFIGVIFSVILFQPNIALAAILIFALGDSFSTLAGKLFGRLKNPFNKLKTVEGSAVGFCFAFLGAIIFVSPFLAIVGSAVGMLVEVIDVKYLKIDDNILVPLVAGIVMSLI